ncbi:M14 family zinc carboxypeptidase [Neotamlana laminarinivorans]|uniref:Peptidase M14 n=1 Tax=Neotamlana laminarinivorans TaxID=2883124 RepID=A0A9X1HZ61_9FLAO|nr:M14 family zinc carboxypeptidase [Tamlana laminarinivorans]MCB4797643.1 peptidase M14 [Tamlana laminarinivorans]
MKITHIQSAFKNNIEHSLKHRYITNGDIEPLLNNIGSMVKVEVIGKSVLNDNIYGLKLGKGNKRILMWSQMHGNESTTTKAIFDLINTLKNETELNYILEACTLYIIPILNPDGAKAYTRVNANQVDLNRDAQNQTQPESQHLKNIFNNFKPDYCFNLHGQRTIFGAGKTNKSATISFLAPAQDENCTVTANRKIAMEIISVMNNSLQKIIPNQVGVYDDAFNINCVGDTFQSENVPTILFEAGHYKNDYARDKTREFIYISYLSALSYISKNNVTGNFADDYFNIPENEKCFFDVIIRNAKINNEILDVAIQYQEQLIDNQVLFIPKVEKIEKILNYNSHNEIDAKDGNVTDENDNTIKIGSENVLVMKNNVKLSLNLK